MSPIDYFVNKSPFWMHASGIRNGVVQPDGASESLTIELAEYWHEVFDA